MIFRILKIRNIIIIRLKITTIKKNNWSGCSKVNFEFIIYFIKFYNNCPIRTLWFLSILFNMLNTN